VLTRIVKTHLDIETLAKKNEDYKSQLQIFCQKNKYKLEYKVLSEEKQSAGKSYIIEVCIDEKAYTRFESYSKRLAEQKAAQLTIELLKKEIG
jgi:ribonuclease-3